MNVHETAACDHPNPAPNEDHSFWTKTGRKSAARVHFVNMFQWLASPALVSIFFRRILASRRTRRRGSCRSASMIEHWREPNNAVSNDRDAPSRTQTIIWQSVYSLEVPPALVLFIVFFSALLLLSLESSASFYHFLFIFVFLSFFSWLARMVTRFLLVFHPGLPCYVVVPVFSFRVAVYNYYFFSFCSNFISFIFFFSLLKGKFAP